MKKMHRTGLVLLAAVLTMISMISPVLGATGKGTLYVYTNSGRTSLAPKDSKGKYIVNIGSPYYIRVKGITEFKAGTYVMVKVCWIDNLGKAQTTVYKNILVQKSGCTLYVDVTWTVPSSAKVGETGTVHYSCIDGKGPDYVASGACKPGHFFVVPENNLGPLGALGAGALAMVAFATIKKRPVKIPIA